jgi:serine/threonine protein kinase
LLTGQKVFPGSKALQMVIDHARTEPVPVSLRAPQPVPEALEKIVMRCLRKDPAERPATARELARELTALGLANAWSEERAREWWLEHPPTLVERTGDEMAISDVWISSTPIRTTGGFVSLFRDDRGLGPVARDAEDPFHDRAVFGSRAYHQLSS